MKKNRSVRGKTAWKRGLWSERLCRLSLRLRGWKIMATRCRTPAGEIDVVARRGNVIAMIEVKARPTLEEARQAISPYQKARLIQAAALFMAGYPHLAHLPVRFDAVVVAPYRWPRHIKDAWRVLG